MQLQNDFLKLTFYENLNARKCHFMCLGKDTGSGIFVFKGLVMNNNKEQKMLGVSISQWTCNTCPCRFCKSLFTKCSIFINLP